LSKNKKGKNEEIKKGKRKVKKGDKILEREK
jgi:hypothetical protein